MYNGVHCQRDRVYKPSLLECGTAMCHEVCISHEATRKTRALTDLKILSFPNETT